MSVWLTIPSARPPEQANPVLQKWRDMGYKIALWVDMGGPDVEPVADALMTKPDYPGYAEAVNRLIGYVGARFTDAQFFVIGGDDTFPDSNKRADEIAAECADHFRGFYDDRRMARALSAVGAPWPDTFGVMQPTGDRYARGQIDRICGSAWIGREFAQRVNQGKGPLWPEYTHMFVDNELQEVALKYGVLWQRPDLTQLHMQYCRESSAIDAGFVAARPPEHIQHDGYTPEHWVKYEKLFLERKAKGFPGSELK